MLQGVEFRSGVGRGGQRCPLGLGHFDQLSDHHLVLNDLTAFGDLLFQKAKDLAPAFLALFAYGFKTEQPSSVADRRGENAVSGDCLRPIDRIHLLLGRLPQLLCHRIFGNKSLVEKVGTGRRKVVHQIFLAGVPISKRLGLEKELCECVAFNECPTGQVQTDELGPFTGDIKIAVIDQEIDQPLLLHLYLVSRAEIDR